ncbi:uncharacterized protein [Miscanthus floridulus]|uniref:uncharacterized protein isoform X2 n=1 Tax=Miscanthus floridulus TaxID=154761 RepID=UPI00345A4E65
MHGGRGEGEAKGDRRRGPARCSRPGERGRAAAAANWHAGGSGVPLPRHLLLGPPCGTSEIEEAPPSPPPAPSRPRLPALNAENAAVALGLAAVAGLEGRVMELQAALEGRLRELEQLRRRDRESEGSKGEEASKRRREGADEPEVAGAEAEVQVLQHQLGTVQESVSGMKDAMLAFRLQAEEMQALEEFWKPVVPVPQPQRNNSKGEEMQALEEFWKPVVPVRQRINSKLGLLGKHRRDSDGSTSGTSS